LAVQNRNPDDLFLLSFEPGKKDHIAPVISPNDFASMRQITLNPKTTRASLSNWWRGGGEPRALKPAELVFTDSGLYQILLGRALGSEDPVVSSCYVRYVDEEKRPGTLLADQVLYDVMNATFHQIGCSAAIWRSAIACPTMPIYRGEPLEVELTSKHPAERIGIVDPDWKAYLLPIEKSVGGIAAGVVSGIRILTGSEIARADSYQSAAASGIPAIQVHTKGGRVFTRSGWYIAMTVPGPRCDSITDVGACWIHYIDSRRSR
jgi:hypothetical protein